MRLGLLAGLVGALALPTAAVAAGTLASPVIHEPWTPLHCPAHPQTTIAFEACAERRVARGDRAIDKAAATLFHLIKAKSDRAAFVAGERSWLSYRRRSCRASASAFRGGSMEPLVFLKCEQRLNKHHQAELAADERTFRPH